jgi:hypothetical protein
MSGHDASQGSIGSSSNSNSNSNNSSSGNSRHLPSIAGVALELLLLLLPCGVRQQLGAVVQLPSSTPQLLKKVQASHML